jgi:hypothetical protein
MLVPSSGSKFFQIVPYIFLGSYRSIEEHLKEEKREGKINKKKRIGRIQENGKNIY